MATERRSARRGGTLRPGRTLHRRGDRVVRFGISLPEDVAGGLDRMVSDRGLPSRSHAIAAMVRGEVLRHDIALGDAERVAGVITVVYRDTARGARHPLSEIQRRHLRATISSQHVFLEDDRSLEVLLVQGPPTELGALRDELAACRAAEQVELVISRAALPPLY
jgi:CopG family nickel-responsive transcriptional regulator